MVQVVIKHMDVISKHNYRMLWFFFLPKMQLFKKEDGLNWKFESQGLIALKCHVTIHNVQNSEWMHVDYGSKHKRMLFEINIDYFRFIDQTEVIASDYSMIDYFLTGVAMDSNQWSIMKINQCPITGENQPIKQLSTELSTLKYF
jgi:hypothetical protein